MNGSTIAKLAAAAGVAYLFRNNLIAEFQSLTGSAAPATAPATNTTATSPATTATTSPATTTTPTTTATTTTATTTTATTPPAVVNGIKASLAALAASNGYSGAAPLNIDEWNYYLARIGTSAGANAEQMDSMIAKTGGDRTVKISIDTFLAAANAAGVFPSGLSGLPSIVPVSAKLIRAAAASPQTASILGTRVYLPAEAWAQLRSKATSGKPSRIQDPGRPITATQYHTLRARPANLRAS